MGLPTVARLLAAVLAAPLLTATAQWTNRYPKVSGFAHHVYLEGYNLPFYGIGPTDPAVSPDGRTIAIGARGWLWLLDLESGVARRLTRGAAMDSRPAWSPDGKWLAAVRDSGTDTSVVLVDARTGADRILADTKALDLDPSFTTDGRAVLFSSAEAGDLDVWQVDLEGGAKTRLTREEGIELQPLALPEGRLAYVVKRRSTDAVVVFDPKDASRRVIVEEGIASQMRIALRPDGRTLAVTRPAPGGWELWAVDVAGGPGTRLSRGRNSAPLTPTWSPDGWWVYYVEADGEQQFHLYRVGLGAGEPETVVPAVWDWGARTAEVEVRTRGKGGRAPVAARLAAVDAAGHPVFPDTGQPRFDSQNGILYAYSPGVLRFTVPEGEVRLTAVRGQLAVPVTATRRAAAGTQTVVDLELGRIADPEAAGWYAGDLHWHLNFGGPYRLRPEDVLVALDAEELHVATPTAANLDVRIVDEEYWDWRTPSPPLVVFSQEVRPHFLGHTQILGANAPFRPYFWGPGYSVYPRLDQPNAEPLGYSRSHGGMGIYVHPVSVREPFPGEGPPKGIPLEFVPDAVMGEVDGLEIACVWSDELGTTDLWYRLLNLGIPIVPSAGSDAMPNFYRIVAIGSARIYAKVDGPLNFRTYLEAVRAGRSVVTTGPLLTLDAGGSGPGGTVTARGGEIECRLRLSSAVAVERVELIVNGLPVWTDQGTGAGQTKEYRATVRVPAGGWIAARAHGGATSWPLMDSYPFAHTAPVWFGQVGSRDPAAARRAAADLLRWMDVADASLAAGYTGTNIPRLRSRFAEARARLEQLR